MKGPGQLLESNVDWGQDLFFLARWRRAHPDVAPFCVAFCSPIDPTLAGVSFSAPPRRLFPEDTEPAGETWYAVSANVAFGMPAMVPDGHGGAVLLGLDAYSALRKLDPAARCGYGILIYKCGPNRPGRSKNAGAPVGRGGRPRFRDRVGGRSSTQGRAVGTRPALARQFDASSRSAHVIAPALTLRSPATLRIGEVP